MCTFHQVVVLSCFLLSFGYNVYFLCLFVCQVIIGYLLKTMFSYPLANFPLRLSLLHLLRWGEPSFLQHTLATLFSFSASLGLALLVGNVSFLFSFVGALARTSLSFLLPGALLLASGVCFPLLSHISCPPTLPYCSHLFLLHPLLHVYRAGAPRKRAEVAIVWLMALFGVIVAFCGVFSTLYLMI